MKIKNSCILLVDDQVHEQKLLRICLEDLTPQIDYCQSADEALLYLEEKSPDLILLDVLMPGMNGFELCRRIRSVAKFAQVPVIFLTAMTETDQIVQGFESGAVDFIHKPFQARELLARVRTHLELKHSRVEMQRLAAELQEKNSLLEEALAKLEILATTDPLTGLANRRKMNEKLEEEQSRIKRQGDFFSLIMLDIDFFKRVNDEYGHDFGDYVLKRMCGLFAENLREQDMVSRWGGEEFLFLLPGTDLKGAKIAAEKIGSRIEAYSFQFHGMKARLTVTAGISLCEGRKSIEKVIKEADMALYQGKQNGRNQVVLYSR